MYRVVSGARALWTLGYASKFQMIHLPIHSILWATDFDQISMVAGKYAGLLANRTGAKVYLFHAFNASQAPGRQQPSLARQDELNAAMWKLAKELSPLNIDCER